jgi:hypothetical protein
VVGSVKKVLVVLMVISLSFLVLGCSGDKEDSFIKTQREGVALAEKYRDIPEDKVYDTTIISSDARPIPYAEPIPCDALDDINLESEEIITGNKFKVINVNTDVKTVNDLATVDMLMGVLNKPDMSATHYLESSDPVVFDIIELLNSHARPFSTYSPTYANYPALFDNYVEVSADAILGSIEKGKVEETVKSSGDTSVYKGLEVIQAYLTSDLDMVSVLYNVSTELNGEDTSYMLLAVCVYTEDGWKILG